MATSRKRNVEIDVVVDDKNAKAKLKGIGDTAARSGKGFSTMAGLAKVGIAGIVGSGLVSFLQDATTAAMEDAKAQDLLKLAIQNATGATDLEVDAAEQWIDTAQRQTGIADDELRPALANLVRATGDVERAQDLMGVAMDIATAKGLPLETVTKAIGKAADGNVGALGRMGIKVRDTEGNMLTLDEAMQEASRTMGGATAAAADTVEGKMRILAISVDEAKESLGEAFLPILSDTADLGNDAATILGFLAEKVNEVEGASSGTDTHGWFRTILDHVPGVKQAADWTEFLADSIRDMEEPIDVSAAALDRHRHSTKDAREELEEFNDEIRGMIDPVFKAVDAVDDLSEAQEATANALMEYGEASPEHREALRKEAEAWLRVKDAQIQMAEQSGLTRDQFEEKLRDMRIFTEAEINLMLEDFDRINNYQFRDKVINIRVKGGTLIGDERAGARATGGPVSKGKSYLVGEQGPEVVTMGGNGFVTPNHALGGGGGSSYSITVNAGLGANPADIGQKVVDAIKAYEKRNGARWRS